MLLEYQRFRILAHVFRDLGFLDLGSCFQRTKGFGALAHVLEDQRFWIPAHVFRGFGFLDLGSCFQRTKRFLGLRLMFSKDQRF